MTDITITICIPLTDTRSQVMPCSQHGWNRQSQRVVYPQYGAQWGYLVERCRCGAKRYVPQ